MGGRRKKLLTAARLFHSHPAKYQRSCADCRRWVHDERTGRPEVDRTKRLPDGRQDPAAFLLRLPAQDPPCHECGKTVGMPFAERHWRFNPPDPKWWHYAAFTHYRRCKAVNWNTPDADDPIVRRNADLFRIAGDTHDGAQQAGLLVALGLLRRRDHT